MGEFSLEQLLGYSIDAERKANKYYNDFSEAAIGKLMKERFKNLARDEKLHEKELLKIHKKEFGDEIVIPKTEGLPKHETEFEFDNIKNMVDSLEKAIRNEENAKKIYVHMAKRWDKYFNEFNYIAMMEKGHAESLSAEYDLFERDIIKDGNTWRMSMGDVWSNVRDRDRID